MTAEKPREAGSADRLMSPKEVADRLSIQPRTAREWMRDGTIPNALKVGARGLLRVHESDVLAFIARQPGVKSGGSEGKA